MVKYLRLSNHENLSGHRQTHDEANDVTYSSRRLRQRHLVADRVQDARSGEDAEVEQSDGGGRLDEDVEEAEEEEGGDVLEVVQVIPGQHVTHVEGCNTFSAILPLRKTLEPEIKGQKKLTVSWHTPNRVNIK